MKKLISTVASVAVFVGFSSGLSAETIKDARPMKVENIQKMDKKMGEVHAIRKNFRNQKEFNRIRQSRKVRHRASEKRIDKRIEKRSNMKRNSSYDYRYNASDGYDNLHHNRYNSRYTDDRYIYKPRPKPRVRQKGYNYFKRGWYLAYIYDRASFNDRYGYHYGYFNRHGYYFEGVFYRYDRDYRYSDRARGKGVFDNRYYIPSNYNYYGFSLPRDNRPRRGYRY